MAYFGEARYFAIMALLASAPVAACVHKDTVLDCHIEGTKYLQTDLNDAELCARFLGQLGVPDDNVQSLTITVHERGIGVRVAMTTGKPVDMAIDIMDRGVRITDMDSLAQTVAGQL